MLVIVLFGLSCLGAHGRGAPLIPNPAPCAYIPLHPGAEICTRWASWESLARQCFANTPHPQTPPFPKNLNHFPHSHSPPTPPNLASWTYTGRVSMAWAWLAGKNRGWGLGCRQGWIWWERGFGGNCWSIPLHCPRNIPPCQLPC